MLLEIFALFLVVGITIIFLGYYTNPDTEILKIVGYLFIFILGVTLAGIGSNGIMYQSGDILTDNGSITTVVSQYSYYTNHTIGYYTSIVAMLGFTSVFLQWRGGNKQND